LCGGDGLVGGVDSLGGLVGRGVVSRPLGVFELVATPAQCAELTEAGTELGSGRLLDGVVPTCGRRTQAWWVSSAVSAWRAAS
jgi:hypothetical protein